MATLTDVLSLVFFTLMVVALGLMVLHTYILARRPIMRHLREIYFVNSTSFRRAWYEVIAAMVFFLAARAVHELAKLGAIQPAPVTEDIFLIAFGSLILAAFIELVLVFQLYIPNLASGDRDIQQRIQETMRAMVMQDDDRGGHSIDLTRSGDFLSSRPTLGPYVGLAHYRGVILGMTQYLENRFGELGDAILHSVGRQSGRALALEMRAEMPNDEAVLDGFLREIRMANLGLPSVVQQRAGRTNVRVEECAACSGMEPQGRNHCHYIAGLFTGLFQGLGTKDVVCQEVKCWVKGDHFCEFQIDHGPGAAVEAVAAQPSAS